MDAEPSSPHRQWIRGEYAISTDPARLDLDLIHRFLDQSSYWATGRSREQVALSVERSLPFGLYHGPKQIGFARVLSDRVTLAYLADVFVLPEHRGRGLSKWLVETVMAHPDLSAVRRWLLGTRDAHGLYARFGFAEPPSGFLMEKVDLQSDHRRAG